MIAQDNLGWPADKVSTSGLNWPQLNTMFFAGPIVANCVMDFIFSENKPFVALWPTGPLRVSQTLTRSRPRAPFRKLSYIITLLSSTPRYHDGLVAPTSRARTTTQAYVAPRASRLAPARHPLSFTTLSFLSILLYLFIVSPPKVRV